MNADLLARLIEAGTPAALVAEVALLVARADAAGEAIEGRRQKDRERQARRRHDMSRDVTLDHVPSREVTAQPSPSPSPSSSPDPSNNPTPAPTREHTPRARPREAFPKPEWADASVWADFLANRRRKGLSNTATAHRKLLADIERIADPGWPPGRLLEAATGRGWGAIYPSLKDEDEGNYDGTGRHHCKQPDRQIDGFTSALRRASAELEARDPR